MALKKNKKRIDYPLLIVVGILIIWGIFTLTTTSFAISLKRLNNSWYYALHQAFFGLLPGLILGLVLFKVPEKFLKRWSYFILAINLLLVLMVFVPYVGLKIGGSRRWLQLGSIRFQPSEFLKITSLLYLSAWFSSERKGSFKGGIFKKESLIVFLILVVVLGGGLLLQPDMSTLVIIVVAGLLVYFVAPTPWWHTMLLGLILGVLGVLFMIVTPYRMARLSTFLNPNLDPLGMGYQGKQARISIGSGGLIGIEKGFGFGFSQQKNNLLPYPISDSIFAVLGEELGFLGTSLFLFLFLIFIWRALRVAARAQSTFLSLLGVGIIGWLASQTFFHIGGLLGLIPLSGIPLPFFSYGSSHLLSELAAVGLLLKVSKDS